MERTSALGMAAILLSVNACSSPTDSLPDAQTIEDPAFGAFSIEQPEEFNQLRAVNLDAIYVNVIINEETQRYEQGTPVTTSVSLDHGDMLSVEVQWFENYENTELLLATWHHTQQVTEDISISVEASDYDYEGDAFDADNDSYSNLVERRNNSDPLSQESTPENVPNARIRWVNPNEAPEVDGLYDSIWNTASFVDEQGEQLFIDNLMINQGAVRTNGNTEFRWFALHDDINLYIFVLGEYVATGTPIRDSTDVWQDDTLSLYFDGDNSKDSSYDGVDDRHILIPLLTSPEDPSSNFTTLVVGANSAPVSGVEFGTCLCSAGQHTWEVKIPMANFNIRKDVPFGFEVHIDEDNDGGARDARWGWFHPARTDEDVDNTWTTPSYMGTVTVE